MTEEETVGEPVLAVEAPPTPVAEVVTVLVLEGPIALPASISGRSDEKDSWMRQLVGQMRSGKFDCLPPTICAVVAFQRFTFCRKRGHLSSWVSGRCE